MPTPHEVEELEEYRKGLESIYERVKGDRELEELVRAICEKEGLRRPNDIAAHLHTSVEDIYNRLKRLRRRFDYLRPQKRTKVV